MIPKVCNHQSVIAHLVILSHEIRRFVLVATCPCQHIHLAVALTLAPKIDHRTPDAVSELAAFSIFDKVDLEQLAKSDVKTAHSPPMGNPRFLSTQSCFVATGSPPRQIEALRKWNPTSIAS